MSVQVAPLRALIVVRLSRLTDESTSPERQLSECSKLCADRGYEVVGVAEDLDVSAGTTSPFERPQLGRWLARDFDPKASPGPDNRVPVPFDVIVFYRLDRLVRSVPHLWRVIEWAEAHDTVLVSASEKHFDLSDKVGRIIVALIATVAELELDAISERNSNAFRHNFTSGKWRGGVPPWGYLPEKDDNGDWRLVQDPVQVKAIREVVDRVMSGMPLRQIAHDMTGRKILTPKDRFAQVQDREVRGYEWHSGPLKRSLSSPTLLGHVVTREPVLDLNGQPKRKANGKKEFGPETVVRSDDGSPVVRAEPILSRAEFDRLQKELKSRENRKEPTKRSNGLLLRVIHCGVCNRPAYRLKGGKGRADRYRCASAQYKDRCENLTMISDEADKAVATAVLALLGDSERQDREWDAGEDHAAEVAAIDADLIDAAEVIGSGMFGKGTPARAKLEERISALSARRDKLASIPSRPAGWVLRGTGELFSDWWERQTPTEQNIYLRSMNVRASFKRGAQNRLNLDLGSLNDMTAELKPGPSVQRARRTFAAMEREGIQGVLLSDADQMPTAAEGYMWLQPTEGVWVYTSEALLRAAEERRAERREFIREKIEDEYRYGPDDDGDWD
ncbi:recombinase family protein [Nocardia sp. NPDC020380]|uniref:recombinase family protein n=1 Tax=Nocardia sp. NPDC020380 TaxID=3364309 RepID=UPI00379C0D07